MIKKSLRITLGLLLLTSHGYSQEDFYAYHTRINSREAFELHSRTDAYADIVVQMPGGQLVFHRKTSYLPYWESGAGIWNLEEIVARHGDGTVQMPDKFNTHSQVKITENNPARIVVNWHYVPEFELISENRWVDEDFVIYPDGRVIRIIRDQSQTQEKWEDPDAWTVKRYEMSWDGIRELIIKPAGTIELSGISAASYSLEEYDPVRETEVIRTTRSKAPQPLIMMASELDRPKLLIKGWGVAPLKEIRINSKPFDQYRKGYIKHIEGSDLILYLDVKLDKPSKVEIIPGPYEAPDNRAPVAMAGDDQWILVNMEETGPFSFELKGSFRDDGNPVSALHTSWKLISGPGAASIENSKGLRTKVTVPSTGSYLFQLRVNDTEFEDLDTLALVVEKDRGVYGNPIAWWNFESGKTEQVTENITGRIAPIAGHSSLVKGVIGNGMQFSEFQNYIYYSANDAPLVNPEEFSVEAWIAPRSSPWYKIPIAMQKDENSGYYFGLDGDNKLFLNVFVDRNWQHCETEPPYPGLTLEDGMERYMIHKDPRISIPMLQWTHVAGTFSSREGIKLYVNGQLKAKMKTRGEMKPAREAGFYMGMETEENFPAHTERPQSGTDKCLFSFDGLMDEIKIYNTALSESEVSVAYQFHQPAFKKAIGWRQAPRGPDEARPFGAYQTTLKFNDQNYDRNWRPGEQADVLVYFDEYDYKIVWWHGVAYYPIYYSGNGIGLTHEVCETRTQYGCAEALMDKACRYAYVQVLENTDARVVVKYRSAASDRRYFIAHEDKAQDGWGCWTDEILTIYPDGSMPRQVTMWCSVQDEWHEFEQENYFFSPGQTPWNVVEQERNTIANLNGEVSQIEWVNNRPEGKYIKDAVIKTYNYRNSASRPYAIIQDGLSVIYEDEETLGDTPLEGAGWWDHWPVSQIPSDGRNPIFPNGHFSSSSSGAIFTSNHRESPAHLDHPTVIKSDNKLVIPFLFGMTTGTAGGLVPLAKMYNHPPKVSDLKGAEFDRYNVFKHEFIFSNPTDYISFTVNATPESPISNICFAIKNWDRDQEPSICINQAIIEPGKRNRQGIIRDTDGSRTLVIWLKHDSTEPVQFNIESL